MIRKMPRYMLVHDSLKRMIETDTYRVGARLPAEPELERLYNVSRTTIRKAVEMLVNQGFVATRQGHGTIVLDYKVTQRLQNVTSFSETLRDQGFEVDHKILSITRETATIQEAEDLKIDSSAADVVKIVRLALANGKPIAIMVNTLPSYLLPDFEGRARQIRSLYLFLEAEYNISIESASETIGADLAVAEDATLLQIEPGDPLLVVRRITYGSTFPIEIADLRINANKYKYSVNTTGRPPRSVRW